MDTGASRKRELMERFLWVCFGSAVGGGARYLVAGWALKALGPAFPYGTLAVNLLGSFLLAGLMFAGVESAAMPPNLRIALTTGAMGGFTTYSTFSYETMRYLQEGAWAPAIGNVTVTVAGCLVACWLGWMSARWLFAS
jgi:CrcB protein